MSDLAHPVEVTFLSTDYAESWQYLAQARGSSINPIYWVSASVPDSFSPF